MEFQSTTSLPSLIDSDGRKIVNGKYFVRKVNDKDFDSRQGWNVLRK